MQSKNTSIAILLFATSLLSCGVNSQESSFNYPNDLNVSSKNGQGNRSNVSYFPAQVTSKVGGSVEYDSVLINWFSKILLKFNEPILYNFYLGTDRYRFLLIRSFHRPVVFTLTNNRNQITLAIKELDRIPSIFEHVEKDESAKDSAMIAVNETKNLSIEQWKTFEGMVKEIDFKNLQSFDTARGDDGSFWILEAHLKNEYHFVERWSPQNSYAACLKYLVNTSGREFALY